MKNMTTEQVKMITSTWKVEKVDLLQSRNIGELMAIDGVKVRTFYSHVRNDLVGAIYPEFRFPKWKFPGM